MYKKPCLEEIFAHFEEFFLHCTISCPIIDSSVSYYVQAVSDVFFYQAIVSSTYSFGGFSPKHRLRAFFVLALISA